MPVAKAYDSLALCGGKPSSSYSCPRLHQLLFNEIVTVLKEEGIQVQVKISNCFYIREHTNTPHHTYWILKKNIRALKDLEQKDIDIELFPAPVTFFEPTSITHPSILTLASPWHDAGTNHTYSTGTRFLKVSNPQESEERVESDGTMAYIFDAEKNVFNTTPIPSTYCIDTPAESDKKIALFIRVLKKWANQDTGCIPYVWGGCSMIATAQEPFIEKNISLHGKPCTYFEIKDFTITPKTGFDCSNLILRAAQLCGIPFFYKNSITMATHLKKIHHDQQLNEGDIIWIPGHVLVVADLKKNTAIEARGYKNKGYGKIQEIELKKLFKGVRTFDDLARLYHDKIPLERLGSDGLVVETVAHFKLLSLASCME